MTFDTPLTPQEETAFQSWKQKNAQRDSGEDYDLRGAFKANLSADPATGHWPDTYKKPNHPTFSDQSQYAKYGKPGRWEGETFIPPAGASSADGPWSKYGQTAPAPEAPAPEPMTDREAWESSMPVRAIRGLEGPAITLLKMVGPESIKGQLAEIDKLRESGMKKRGNE